jgi:hypothetical protein
MQRLAAVFASERAGKAVRHPVQQYIYPWIKGDHVLEHQQRTPTRMRKQAIKEEEK